jgi:DNA repair protein RecO (recombination protein O)
MAIIKTEGLIIRVMDYLESSKIVTCFTPDYGKISLLAKGARRPKSRLGGSLDLLQHVAVVYYQKDTRELQTLSQVDVITSFQSFQSDLKILSFGLGILELVNKLELSKNPNPKLFYHSLEALNGLEESKNQELVFYQFIWKWLEGAGFHPKLRRCLSCLQIPNTKFVKFSISEGGYYCQNCSIPVENSMDISEKCLKLLWYLRENSAKKVGSVSVPRGLILELTNLSLLFLRYHSGEIRNLKSLDFLKRIQ